MGYMLLRIPIIDTSESIDCVVDDTSKKEMFFQAFLVAIGNPKAIVFFTALFPQFISNDNNDINQFIMLVLVLGIIAFSCMIIYSFIGHKASGFFKVSKIGKYLNKFVGSIFISTGCAIIVNK
jgi:threonine/homoserine/homoserine lactone efflux protein